MDDNTLKIQVEEVNPPSSSQDGFKGGNSLLGTGLLSGATSGFPSLMGQVVGGFTRTLHILNSVIQSFEALEDSLDKFAAKIEANSPQVQIGQAIADLNKLRADLRADQIVGPQLRRLIESQSEQAAAITEIEAEFSRAIAPLVQEYQETKTLIAQSLVEPIRKLATTVEGLSEATVDNWNWLIGFTATWTREGAEREMNIEKRRREDEKQKSLKTPIEGFLEFLRTQPNFPVIPKTDTPVPYSTL